MIREKYMKKRWFLGMFLMICIAISAFGEAVLKNV